MKKVLMLFSAVLLVVLVLSACASASQPQATEPPAATQPPATEAMPAATEAPTEAPAATSPTAAPQAIQHTDVPAGLPDEHPIHLGDQSTATSFNPQRALAGDDFSKGRFERPYNANTMDVYSPYLDLRDVNFYISDPMWIYTTVTLVGTDLNNRLPGTYGLELDLDLDGYGDLLILAAHPSSTDWTTDGVQVFSDSNNDVGGLHPILADSAGASGDGYETVVFDQGQGDDPDAAWVRISADDPTTLDLAFKQSLLNDRTKYLVGAWAGMDALNPSKFDLNDHYTYDQAGAASQEAFPNYYPIKALAELDNTCRQAINFNPSGKEPGVCPVQ